MDQATRGLRRLARTNLFANITPTLRLGEATAPVLEVTVEEHPYVSSITIQGLQDLTSREIREDIFPTQHWESPRKHRHIRRR